jgi:hypothetical protein
MELLVVVATVEIDADVVKTERNWDYAIGSYIQRSIILDDLWIFF